MGREVQEEKGTGGQDKGGVQEEQQTLRIFEKVIWKHTIYKYMCVHIHICRFI